jgi:hypothetical protein
MDTKSKDKNTQTPPYPRNADERQDAISKALQLTLEKGETLYQAGTFPFDDLLTWIRREFGADKGYSSDFVLALIRNLKGLIAWVYGDGSEPYWPGQDEDQLPSVP